MKFSSRRARKWGWGVLAVAIILVAALGLLRDTRTATEPYRKTTIAMGSVVTHTVYDANAEKARTAAENAAAGITALEQRISCKRSDSEISAINRDGHGTVSTDTAALLTAALQVQQETNGLYNICTRPLTLLWDFDAEVFTIPAKADLQNACALVRAAHCTVNGTAVTLLPQGAGIDLGSAGKGAACDVAVNAYKSAGCTAGIAAVGGSIGLYGKKPDGSAWRLGVRDPNGDASAQLGTLTLHEGFVSTSGTYEKVREYQGTAYHHLLDPSSGMPCESDLVSATVVCNNGALSDILATACVLLGRTDGTALLQAHNADYVLVTRDGIVQVSDGLQDAFSLTASGYTLAASNGS